MTLFINKISSFINSALMRFPEFFILLLVFFNVLYLLLSRHVGVSYFGLLGFLSFPPLIYLVYFGKEIRELNLSAVLGIIAVLIYCVQWLFYPGGFQHYSVLLNTTGVLTLSVLYGLIAMNCCLIGTRMEGQYISQNAQNLRNNVVLVSIAVAFFSIALESGRYSGALLMLFVFMALAISFLYLTFGFFSKNDDGTVNSLILFIYLVFCFSIGVTFSAIILEICRVGSLFSAHWVFLCTWSLFLCSVCLVISKRKFQLYERIQDITKYVLGD